MNDGDSTVPRKIDFHGAVAHCNPETPVRAFDAQVEAIREHVVAREIIIAALRADDPKDYLEGLLAQAERAAA